MRFTESLKTASGAAPPLFCLALFDGLPFVRPDPFPHSHQADCCALRTDCKTWKMGEERGWRRAGSKGCRPVQSSRFLMNLQLRELAAAPPALPAAATGFASSRGPVRSRSRFARVDQLGQPAPRAARELETAAASRAFKCRVFPRCAAPAPISLSALRRLGSIGAHLEAVSGVCDWRGGDRDAEDLLAAAAAGCLDAGYTEQARCRASPGLAPAAACRLLPPPPSENPGRSL